MPGRRIRAAGAVVIRDGLVAVVHRPRYGDWALPKGKAEPGESLPATAAREVFEETGITVRLDTPLAPVSYDTPDGPKTVWWWRGRLLSEGSPTAPAAEIDSVKWLEAGEALGRLSYADERRVLEDALGRPDTTPFVLLRHAHAVKRKAWDGGDWERPLSAEGFAQLPAVSALLAAYGVGRVVSSPARRCVQTVTPYAEARGLDVTLDAALSEEAGAATPVALRATVAEQAGFAGRATMPTAICLHRPNLPDMLAAVGVKEQALEPGGAIVLHLDEAGGVVAQETHEN